MQKALDLLGLFWDMPSYFLSQSYSGLFCALEKEKRSLDVLKGILAAFDAGLWFGISIESPEDHLDLGLDLG